jgi:hypothetical protein
MKPINPVPPIQERSTEAIAKDCSGAIASPPRLDQTRPDQTHPDHKRVHRQPNVTSKAKPAAKLKLTIPVKPLPRSKPNFIAGHEPTGVGQSASLFGRRSIRQTAKRTAKRTVKYLTLTLCLGGLTYAGLEYFRLLGGSATGKIYPTAIHWLSDKRGCEKTGRSWDGEKCWDAEHSPEF